MELLDNVAIIGAGLGGCALALALSQNHIPVQVFESRPEIAEVTPSGVILTPNGLRVLDRLGVFERIRHRCYISTHRIVKNRSGETTRETPIQNDKYGYSNHRIWRSYLLDEMRAMLSERSVPIHYNSCFGGIVSEDGNSGVVFQINDAEEKASLLVGSDGIYSTVRKHLAPEIVPEYTGLLAVLAHIKRANVEWPYEGCENNGTIQDEPGALIWMAEDPAGEDLMVGIQTQHPEQSREALAALQADKDKLLEFYGHRYDDWGSTAQKIIDEVTKQKQSLYAWPFLKMPKIPQWYSPSGRVVLVGDGAHAMPPASGQGVNQCLEDIYSLTLLLLSLKSASSTKVLQALAFWQETRQRKIDLILDWMNNTINVERLGQEERRRLVAEGKIKEGQTSLADDMGWLFGDAIEDEFGPWIERNLKQ